VQFSEGDILNAAPHQTSITIDGILLAELLRLDIGWLNDWSSLMG
jgi:hypothetical protein